MGNVCVMRAALITPFCPKTEHAYYLLQPIRRGVSHRFRLWVCRKSCNYPTVSQDWCEWEPCSFLNPGDEYRKRGPLSAGWRDNGSSSLSSDSNRTRSWKNDFTSAHMEGGKQA